MGGSGNGSGGGRQQRDRKHGSERGSQRDARPEEPTKQPKNSVIGFLRQRLSATEAQPAEAPRKPAIKSQLADKSRCVLCSMLPDKFVSAGSFKLDGACICSLRIACQCLNRLPMSLSPAGQ